MLLAVDALGFHAPLCFASERIGLSGAFAPRTPTLGLLLTLVNAYSAPLWVASHSLAVRSTALRSLEAIALCHKQPRRPICCAIGKRKNSASVILLFQGLAAGLRGY
ncbi:MAG: hypothetical protein WAM28_03890 [Chlamydiales bacterium]